MIFSLLSAGSDRDANLVLEDGTENPPRELSAITEVGGVKKSNGNELDSIGDKIDSIDNDSDSIDDKIDSYYVDDNLADGASADRKRIDRSDSLDVVPTTMRGIPLADLLRSTVTRGFYVTKTGSPEQGRNVILTDSTESPTTLIVRDDVRTTSVTDTTVTNLESSDTFTTSTLRETVTATSNSVGTTLAEFNTTESSTNPASVDPLIDESSTNPTSVDSLTEKSSTNPTSVDPSIKKSSTNPASVDLSIESSSPTESPVSTEAIATNVPEEVTETRYIESESTTVSKTKKTDEETSTSTTTPSSADRSRRREKLGSEYGEKSSPRSRFKNGGEPSVKRTESRQTPRRRVIVGRRRRPISTTPATNYSVVADAKTTAKPIREETEIGESTLSSIDAVTNESTGNRETLNEDGTDRFEAEVNSSRNTSAQSPGSLLSTRLRKPVPTQQQSKSSNTFSNHRKSRPTGGHHSSESEKQDAVDKTTEATKLEKDIDQSSRAQEIAVTLADPPPSQSSTTGRPALRNAFRRKISTTIAPRSDATTTTASSTTTTTSRSTLRFTRVHKDRQKTRSQEKPVQNATTRPRRPQVIDYDYYEDEDESVIGKSTLNGKLFLTSKGSIRCLDQGNFPHPYSCRKFITCARMVNGMVVGAEYTCPDKLSYDPVGGICNWSAGLGCKD